MNTTQTTKTKKNKDSESETPVIPKVFVNLSPSMLLVLDSDGIIVEINDNTSNKLQTEPALLLNTSIFDLLPADIVLRFKNVINDCLHNEIEQTLKTTLKKNDGALLETELSFFRYEKDTQKKELYCIIKGRDISVEKQTELDLLRFSNLAHYTVNPLEITDINGKIIYVNPAFEKASGYSKEELLGKNPNVFGSGKHPKSFWQAMWATISAGKVWSGEVENQRRNGEPFPTHLLISPIINPEGKIVGFFGIHRDITEQKQLEQQLIHAQKMESIGLLAAGVAHEVGNPLTSISSLVQILQRTTNDEFTNEKLELIKHQVTRISRTIRNLVDFSRRSVQQFQVTDIHKILRESVEIVRVGRKAKEIYFDVHIDEQMPILRLVPDQIEQVFINILINAVDAIHEKSREQEKNNEGATQKQIFVTTSHTKENVTISIRDTGKGIPEKELPKIFEPFFTTKRVGEGTGLGLWVSYGIIKSFQGTLSVQSEPNKGTTFIISLPISEL